MTPRLPYREVFKDRDGAAAIEFALLAPVVIVMLLGVLMIGLYMQAYNSVRSIAFDVERYTVVEYQKNNNMLPAQITQVAYAIGRQSPYNFDSDRLYALVEEEPTGVTGAKKYLLTLSYTPAEISAIMKIQPPTITQTQSIIVPTAS